jgi:copper chaperone NosL
MNSREIAPTFLLILLLAIPGLAGAETKVPPPVAIDPAIDACTQCKMSIKDSGYASELIAKDGRVYKFDDIGCYFEFSADNPSIKAAARYVQDAKTHDWVAFEKAYFVVSKEVSTPMGSGIHAFASKDAAAAFAKARKDGPKIQVFGDLKVEPSSGTGM